MPFAFLFALYVIYPDSLSLRSMLNLCLRCSGVASTVFLWMIDVDKSRTECDEFVLAEGKRKAFNVSALNNPM